MNGIEASRKPIGKLVPFKSYLQGMGRSDVWGWRARRRGWLCVVNIAGRVYISYDEIAKFEARAAAGEFAKTVHPPAAKEKERADA